MIINRVRPLSVGKIAAFLYGIIGLFIGAVFAVFALFGGLMSGAAGAADDAHAPGRRLRRALWRRRRRGDRDRADPLRVLGFLGAVIMAFIYNVVSRIVGGIEVDVS